MIELYNDIIIDDLIHFVYITFIDIHIIIN